MLKSNEDLFAESTMSFGDHLEELRICLWRAILWLFIGFLVGLFFSRYVVAYIQKPLNVALEKYYTQDAEKNIKNHSEELIERGVSPGKVVRLSRDHRLIAEVLYVFPEQIAGISASQENLSPDFGPEIDPTRSVKAIDQVDNLNQYPRSADPVSSAAQESEKTAEMSLEEEVHSFFAAKKITDLVPIVLFKPANEFSGTRAKALGVHETFSIFIKAALMLGFVIASPGIFHSIWSFVASGLYLHERKYIYTFMPISIGLFIAGACVAFFFVFRFVLEFLFTFNSWMNIDPDTRITEWINFAFILPICFGISFQLPLVIFVLERVGILTVEQLVSKWKVAVLVIFVVSMFLTPADPQSLFLMATPLCALYFLGIFMCRVIPKRSSAFEE